MKSLGTLIAVGLLLGLGMLSSSASPQNNPNAADAASQGIHGFDFEFGHWQVHHRVKSATDGKWKEFDGTSLTRPFMAGQGDIEERVFARPTGVTYGTAIRAYAQPRAKAVLLRGESLHDAAQDPSMLAKRSKEGRVSRIQHVGRLNRHCARERCGTCQ